MSIVAAQTKGKLLKASKKPVPSSRHSHFSTLSCSPCKLILFYGKRTSDLISSLTSRLNLVTRILASLVRNSGGKYPHLILEDDKTVADIFPSDFVYYKFAATSCTCSDVRYDASQSHGNLHTCRVYGLAKVSRPATLSKSYSLSEYARWSVVVALLLRC